MMSDNKIFAALIVGAAVLTSISAASASTITKQKMITTDEFGNKIIKTRIVETDDAGNIVVKMRIVKLDAFGDKVIRTRIVRDAGEAPAAGEQSDRPAPADVGTTGDQGAPPPASAASK